MTARSKSHTRVRTLVESLSHLESKQQDLLLALIVVILIAGTVLLLGFATVQTIIQLPWPGFHYVDQSTNPLSYMANYDAPDYLYIATHGYTNGFWVNWFPLYPAIVYLANIVIRNPLYTGLAVSWSALVGAIYYYIKIARRLFDLAGDIEPLAAVIFFVLFPTGVFLVAPYSESLTAFCALAAIYAALSSRWLRAGLFAMFASAAHIDGVFCAALVGLILLEQHASIRKAIAATVIGISGLGLYMAYLWATMGTPLGFLTSQQVYHHWTNFGFSHLITMMTLSNFVFILLLVASIIYWWRHSRRSFALYSAMFLAILLLGRQYGGFDRYVLLAFPVQWMAFDLLRNRTYLLPYVTAALGIAWAYVVVIYTGGFVGS